MADNIEVTPGSGKTIAADDIGSVLYQRVKLTLGDDGVTDGDVSSAHPMPVDGSGVTQPVSGTFWQATQPVSGTVTANAGSGTLAVSAASLPLPSGASTAAKQPALGTAGTASADVISVQGVASMTALKVDGSAVTQPISGAVSFTAPQHVIADSGTISTITNVVHVDDNSATISVDDGAGSLTIDGTVTANAGTGNFTVVGPTASGSSIAAAPVTTGGRAATTNPTAVTDGQVVNAMFDKVGKLVSVDAVRILKGTQKTTLSNTTTETTIVTAVASTFLDLYGLILANTGATTTKVDIRDTTAGSIILTIEVPTLETRGFMLQPGGAIPQTTVNTNWTAQCAAATTAMEVTAIYVKNL